MKYYIAALCLFLSWSMSGQIQDSEQTVYRVEEQKFKPANADQIRDFEGRAPMQFLAPDVDGKETFLGSFKGKTVFVYFFNQDCPTCQEHISSLNLLQEEKGNDLKIIAIGDGTKESLKSYQQAQGINYSVLYNGRLLGEAAYGIEMGYPRLFIIDHEGITRHVLPEEAFHDTDKTYVMLENLYQLVNAK